MILIIGSHNDDVLYVQSLLNKKSEEMLFGRYPLSHGTIFAQEAMVLSGVYTSVLASSLVSYLLTKYYVNLIFCLGICYTVDEALPVGSIALSKGIVGLDVDQIESANLKLREVPGIPTLYRVQNDLVGYVCDGFRKRTIISPTLTTFLSSDNLESSAVRMMKEKRTTLGLPGPFAIDSLSYGVALSATLHDVPMISVKAVERSLEQERDVERYLSALERFIDIGKAVVYTIGDIGRNDVLRLRRGIGS